MRSTWVVLHCRMLIIENAMWLFCFVQLQTDKIGLQSWSTSCFFVFTDLPSPELHPPNLIWSKVQVQQPKIWQQGTEADLITSSSFILFQTRNNISTTSYPGTGPQSFLHHLLLLQKASKSTGSPQLPQKGSSMAPPSPQPPVLAGNQRGLALRRRSGPPAIISFVPPWIGFA